MIRISISSETGGTGENGFSCPVPGCKKILTRRDSLHRHIRTHDESTKESFRCEIQGCNRAFREIRDLKAHTKRQHALEAHVRRQHPHVQKKKMDLPVRFIQCWMLPPDAPSPSNDVCDREDSLDALKEQCCILADNAGNGSRSFWNVVMD
ncbi:hypothetical protein BJ912DRAFT_1042502 [Pholiota molesta]|nr:hypothetical protein BJ912DRAFT_1042502 [Pholiota molesta]